MPKPNAADGIPASKVITDPDRLGRYAHDEAEWTPAGPPLAVVRPQDKVASGAPCCTERPYRSGSLSSTARRAAASACSSPTSRAVSVSLTTCSSPCARARSKTSSGVTVPGGA